MASFDENGKYIKTNWKNGDRITADKLNKIEESIEAVNGNKIKGLINVKDFGAKGDGVTDDTTAIQQALNLDTGGFKWVYIPDGTYLINQVSKIKLKSNTRLEFSSDAKFIAKEMNRDVYSMLDVVNVENIEIINPTLIGDRDYNNQTTEGAGHGISCRGVTNLKITGAKCSECFTDGIYLTNITNGLVEYFTCDHNRRQGISITKCDRLVLRHGVCSNTDGIAPKMGIDIEPNFATDNIKGLVLENIQTINNATSGIGINLSHLQNNNDVDISLLNCIDTGSNQGLSFANYTGVTNENSIIYVQNYKSYNAKACGINICGWRYEGSPRIVLDSPTVIHPNMNKGIHERQQNVGISINGDVSTWVAGTPQGRVDIIRPTIIAADDNPLLRGIYVGFNGPLKEVRIIDPLKIDIGDVDTISRNNARSYVSVRLLDGYEDVKITDTYNALSLDVSASAGLIRNYNDGVFSSFYVHDVYSSELKDFVNWAVLEELTVVFKGLTLYGKITLPTDKVFYYDGNILEGRQLQCTNTGSVKIKRLTNDMFNIEKIYGTWTVL